MSKIFSPLNILTILVLVGVAYLSYSHFTESAPSEQGRDIETVSEEQKEAKNDPGSRSRERGAEEDHKTPTPEIIRDKDEVPERIKEQEEKDNEERREGFYENQTYHYQVTFPKDWPLKISTKEKVAFGHTFPENGMGAVKVEVDQDAQAELEDARDQAQSQPGITIEETSISVDGVSATKYTLVNSMAEDKDFFILVEKYGYDYIIKYPDESPEFVGLAEKVVNNFKFTK